MSAAAQWAEELEAWRVPDEILAQAPESPWGFPPHLFAVEQVPVGELHRVAREALAGSGSVLDVGCGGGGASVPLVPPATRLTGVDSSAEMLDSYARAADGVGVLHNEIKGGWPDVAEQTPAADVVVCRNVVYNVAPIVPFVAALTDHAARRVVVEFNSVHPSAPLAPLWKRFWDLPRPDGPTAELFIAVLGELGIDPDVATESRPSMLARAEPGDHVAFIRRRLCLDPSRDPEIASALDETSERGETTAVVVSWSP